ncbi:uncharacterized protein LOC111371755 [Olea europaea var. sylvestris]|uniref:uncharacterized protein LOC111371755 n=1 Tax=Olea europaea var. sylvestris TaxID=158386 RepID=UPI000C1D7534|nr:uncharacterized protein LOC111371755 [Olea europaea var. sylvestris]
MGYLLRVRFASFFTSAALASAAGLYFLHKDYKIAHHAIFQQEIHHGRLYEDYSKFLLYLFWLRELQDPNFSHASYWKTLDILYFWGEQQAYDCHEQQKLMGLCSMCQIDLSLMASCVGGGVWFGTKILAL